MNRPICFERSKEVGELMVWAALVGAGYAAAATATLVLLALTMWMGGSYGKVC
ncbi:MAG TPA: hypothetical protein VNK82_12995 [Terriglobales bacterium]|nr:hypothetical protein [Terriglobales bacterium]